ncbi:MAG TPA: hypothetical protein VNH18_00160, partial [Bryobacteraceae bacterium]|nr:hypothetical protein [Bryobacteraceae bacterium]
PCFLFVKHFRWDSGFGAPQRLHVLMQYGEGPHIAALCVLPAALGAMWLAIRARRPGMLALAALLCALVVGTNFYGATALALFTPLLVWSVWVGERDWRVPARALGVAALAYGLSAFWLTPGYIAITLTNLRLVADPGDRRSVLIFVAAITLFGVVSFVIGNGKREREWPLFLSGAVWVLALYVLGHDYFGLQVAGNTVRLAPELDLAMMLAFATAIVMAWKRPKFRIAAGMVAVLVVLVPSQKYLKHLWSPFPELKSLEREYPYEVAKWTKARLPGARVLPSGTVRFWFNAWTNMPQTDGGSQQGMLNHLLPVAFWQILTGEKQEAAVLWLQALGTDAVIVPDKNSRDRYRDYMFPEKFEGLPVLYDDGHGTVIYRIPRAYPGIGRVVDSATLARVGPIQDGVDVDRLSKYVGETEKAGRVPVTVAWQGLDEVRVTAKTGVGESVLLQETWDEAWRAQENGKSLEVRRDPAMGFMLILTEPGEHNIQLRFTTPVENRIGQILTLLSLLTALGLGAASYGTLRDSPRRVTSGNIAMS